MLRRIEVLTEEYATFLTKLVSKEQGLIWRLSLLLVLMIARNFENGLICVLTFYLCIYIEINKYKFEKVEKKVEQYSTCLCCSVLRFIIIFSGSDFVL